MTIHLTKKPDGKPPAKRAAALCGVGAEPHELSLDHTDCPTCMDIAAVVRRPHDGAAGASEKAKAGFKRLVDAEDGISGTDERETESSARMDPAGEFVRAMFGALGARDGESAARALASMVAARGGPARGTAPAAAAPSAGEVRKAHLDAARARAEADGAKEEAKKAEAAAARSKEKAEAAERARRAAAESADAANVEAASWRSRAEALERNVSVVEASSSGDVHVPEMRAAYRPLGSLVRGAEPADFPVRVFETLDGTILSSAECRLVPELDALRIVEADQLAALMIGWEKRHNAYCWGPTGAGKSTLVEYACALTGRPLIRVNMDSGIDRLHFVGKDTIRSDGTRTWTEFQDGVLLQALRLPCVLLVDEIDFAQPDVLYVLQRVLEGKGLLLMEEGNRFCPANADFRLVATANTNGQGDAQAVYRGAKELSIATMDRFSTCLKIGYLSKEEEVALLRNRFPGIPDSLSSPIAAFAHEVRTAFLQGDLLATLSPRQTMAVADLALTYKDLKRALRQVVFERLGEDDRRAVAGLCQRATGISF